MHKKAQNLSLFKIQKKMFKKFQNTKNLTLMKIWENFFYLLYYEVILIENGFKINPKPFKSIK